MKWLVCNMKKSFIERFDARFYKNKSGCWIWTPNPNRRYGIVRYKGKNEQAHRVAWIINYGDIPEGMNVCHKCDVTKCVNPDHLFLGTQKDNVRDMFNKGRDNISPAEKGEKHHNAKLNEAFIINVRSIYKYCDITQTDLAKIYKIKRRYLCKILSGKVWSHIYG